MCCFIKLIPAKARRNRAKLLYVHQLAVWPCLIIVALIILALIILALIILALIILALIIVALIIVALTRRQKQVQLLDGTCQIDLK
jgi:ABC-type transport system involved in multi-copper enzyme maturation permease subunit